MNDCKEVKVDVEWRTVHYSPVVAGPFFIPMDYPSFEESRSKAQLTVYMQGYVDDLKHELVFLTVHDVGSSPLSFIRFANTPPMAQLRDRSLFLHVCVPGQEPGAPDLVGKEFPTMDQLAEAMPDVLAKFGLKKCIGLGEGAGADILCRFAMNRPDLVAGVVLIHCTSTTHGIIEHLREIFANLRLEDGQMTHAAWNYLIAHKFGEGDKETKKHYIEQIRAELNEHNLSRFLFSFSNRIDFTELLKKSLAKVDVILLTGGKSPHNKNIFHMYDNMDTAKTGLLVAEDVVDILAEAPEYLAQALTLLCQRHILHDIALPTLAVSVVQPTSWEVSSGNDNEETTANDNSCALKSTLAAVSEPDGGQVLVGPEGTKLLLPDQEGMDRHGSSVSGFRCAHCGKDCCWCAELPPGLPVE